MFEKETVFNDPCMKNDLIESSRDHGFTVYGLWESAQQASIGRWKTDPWNFEF